jgi:hypothetical protein
MDSVASPPIIESGIARVASQQGIGAALSGR